MRLGSREPLKPGDEGYTKAPNVLDSGIAEKRAESEPEAKAAAKAIQKAPARAAAVPAAPKGKATRATLETGKMPALPGADEPAIALIESASIAIGYLVADTIVKKAPVRLLRAQTVSPGKFIVLYTGDVASVEEAHAAGKAAVAESLIDELLLPNVHETVLPALEGLTTEATLDSFGIIETFSFASTILAADTAVKAAPVRLIEVRTPAGLGGKSFLTLSGGLEDLQAAMTQALDRIRPGGMICRYVLIPNPHSDLHPFVF
ncbi:MAG: BMC domain-containing protein [Candidatus Sericytochromatia bacterium]|uniref:BMC domain-containing protein n=1 Tax=Candidatus Tanganyikabacteria bacterium TaxID=2961651 RepID=A0A937X6E4_9BACT|nr:BMC domain-containing protein [Candidatus Tanganyikabacteria bacterium]